ncbi:MAG: DUF4340 domain-containing protein [Oscillospiraceae bacterium]|nr:DUF4340 domain-containing protein [Oscillospiraceae bacterium]
MKRPVLLAALALVLLAALVIVRVWPERDGGRDGYDHVQNHGGYMVYMDTSLVETVAFVPRDGAAFTITAKDGGFWVGEDCDSEEAAVTALYASALPYYRMLDGGEAPLGDYGLDPPELTVTVNGEITFHIGGATLDGNAYYMLMNGNVFTVDWELAEQLLLPLNAYRIRELWPGGPGERPLLTEVSLSTPQLWSVYGGYTIIRNELDDDAPPGLSRYELTRPVSFVCNDDAVRTKILNGITAIDYDEIADGMEPLSPAFCHTLRLKAEGFELALYIGGEAPDGGRYIMPEGGDTVYIDKLGDYGFLDVTPLDLTYGLAFWLYRMDDVESITVTDGGRVRAAPEGTSEINMRRFFAHVLNFSVAGMIDGDYGDFDRRITLHMTDGSARELSFARLNERRLAVSVDGAEPVFACNIRDWQQIIEDLDALEAGRGIRE